MNARNATRRSTGAALSAVLVVLGTLAPAAAADGPGYGGTADQLTVAWVASDATTTADVTGPLSDGPGPVAVVLGGGRSAGVVVTTDGQPSVGADSQRLQVNGLGFRARSRVTIRIGDGAPVSSRSDTAGSLDVAIDPALLGGTRPGLTVVAIGRAPSGTAVTLYGSVPPKADGAGPMGLIPWVALMLLTAGLAIWMRGRHRRAAAHGS